MICEECKTDLTYTSNCEDFRIKVESEKIPNQGGAVTLINVNPAFDRDLYFCDEQCLSRWFMRRYL